MGFFSKLFGKKREEIILPIEIEEKIHQIVNEIKQNSRKKLFWRIVDSDLANEKINSIKGSMLAFARNMYGKLFEDKLAERISSINFEKKHVRLKEVKETIRKIVIEFINWRDEVQKTISTIKEREEKVELSKLLVFSLLIIAFISFLQVLPSIQKTGKFVFYSSNFISMFLLILEIIAVAAVIKFFLME